MLATAAEVVSPHLIRYILATFAQTTMSPRGDTACACVRVADEPRENECLKDTASSSPIACVMPGVEGDELVLPQVPEAKPNDPEDVSWALSTAEAMWARGDHVEGLKWVRRAAEAASDAENAERSSELAKAAADLAGLVSKRAPSRASIHIEDDELM